MWGCLLCACFPLGTWPETEAWALTANWTSDPLVHRPTLNHWATPARAKLLILLIPQTCDCLSDQEPTELHNITLTSKLIHEKTKIRIKGELMLECGQKFTAFEHLFCYPWKKRMWNEYIQNMNILLFLLFVALFKAIDTEILVSYFKLWYHPAI